MLESERKLRSHDKMKRKKWTRRDEKENVGNGYAVQKLTKIRTVGQKRPWTLQDEEEDQLVVVKAKKRCTDQLVESEKMVNEVEVASLEWPQLYPRRCVYGVVEVWESPL